MLNKKVNILQISTTKHVFRLIEGWQFQSNPVSLCLVFNTSFFFSDIEVVLFHLFDIKRSNRSHFPSVSFQSVKKHRQYNVRMQFQFSFENEIKLGLLHDNIHEDFINTTQKGTGPLTWRQHVVFNCFSCILISSVNKRMDHVSDSA